MPKSITVQLPGGGSHTYDNVPDNVTQEQAQTRAAQEFGGAIRAGSPEASAMTHTVASEKSPATLGHSPVYYDKNTGEMRPLTKFEKFIYGYGKGIENIGLNAAEMLGLTSKERVKEAQQESAPVTQRFPGNVGSFVGETVALAPIGMGVAGLAGKGGLAARGVLAGITEGATQGAVAAGPDDRIGGLVSGAATGGALPSAARMAQLLGRGAGADTAARRLMQRGVELTPGQMNPKGAWAQIEEGLMAVPVIGPRIAEARAGGWRQTQNLIAQEAAPPGVKLQPRNDPQVMFRDLQDAYDKAYEVGKGYPMMPVIMQTGQNIPLRQALQIGPRAVADDASRKYAQQFLNNELSFINKQGARLSSEDLLGVRSRIRAEIRDLKKNPNAPFKAADLLENAEGQVSAALTSQLPPDVTTAIKAIDGKYGNFKVIEDALYRASDRPEGFTPAQFSQAVRSGTTSRAGYAGGGGRMRDLSGAAAEVFPTQQPMTGRQLATLAPAAAAATLGATTAPYATGLAAGLAALPYAPGAAGQFARRVVGGQTQVQQAIRSAERAARRTLTPQERESVVRFMQTMGVAAQNQE